MTSRSRGARVLVMLVMLLGSVLASAAGADTTDDLTRARDRMVAAQAAADAGRGALRGRARRPRAARGPARPDPAAHRGHRSRREGVDEAGAGDRGARRTSRPASRRSARCSRAPTSSISVGAPVCSIAANAPNVATIDRLAAVKDDLDHDHAHVAAAEKDVGATRRVAPSREQPGAAGAHRGGEREGPDRTAVRADTAEGDPRRRARDRRRARSRA